MKIYELLATPDKWTQKAYARTVDGTETGASDSNATCYCLAGAMIKVGLSEQQRMEAKKKIERASGNYLVIMWNDAPERTHAEVLELCKKLDI